MHPIKALRKTFVLISLILATPAFSLAADYTVDASHTVIMFKVRHMGISRVTGRFKTLEGSFSFDPNDIKSARASASITAKSIDTDVEKRDTHLKSAEFLNVEQHPLITFKTKNISNIKGNAFTVNGELSIAGITKSIALNAEFGGTAKDPWGNDRIAFTATAKINRKDFGITWNKLLETGGLVVGEDVSIIIEVEGIRNKKKEVVK